MIATSLISYIKKPASPTKNDALKWNGTAWVAAAYNASFTFSIASFTSNLGAAIVEIAIGVWKAAGAISFSATYSNGPATEAHVVHSGWTNLTMGGIGFIGPTLNTETVNFPSVGGSQSFQLSATDGTDTSTSTITVYFYNRRYNGVSANTSLTEAQVEALATSELSNSKAITFSVNAADGEYIYYAYPKRLGTAIFYVGGFEGGFQDPETVSITNASGYTEDYYVYRSINSGLGATTVVVV